MIKILFFLFALYRWFKGDRATFYLILQLLVFEFYHFIPKTGIRGDDLALIGVFITFGYAVFQEKIYRNVIHSNTKYFITVMVIIILLSILYYELPIIQILAGFRQYLFVLCIYDIQRMKYYELKNFFKKLFYLNIIACLLFIIQTFIHLPIYHDGYEKSKIIKEGYLGIKRVYTFPTLTSFACLYSIFISDLRKLSGKIFLLIGFGCLLCIQSRGMLLNVTALIIIGYFMAHNKYQSKIIGLLFIFIAIYFINATMFSGETGIKTLNDFSQITTGNVFQTDYEVQGDATFTYRIGLFVKAIYKMIDSSITTLLFGYGFFIELPAEKLSSIGALSLASISWNGYALFTPDISYVNLIYHLGILGSIVYIRFFYIITKQSYSLFSINNKFALLSFLYTLYLLFIGLDGSNITYSSSLLIPFLLLQASKLSNKNKIK